jgi:hypothetical protein
VLAWSAFADDADEAVARQAEISTQLELARLAAALATYRAIHERYPETLAKLVPEIVDEPPLDLYDGNPFVYRRDGDSFLLYSVGLNGEDDGGSDISSFVLEGRPYDGSDWEERIPVDADDIAIRVPCPKFEVPRPPF